MPPMMTGEPHPPEAQVTPAEWLSVALERCRRPTGGYGRGSSLLLLLEAVRLRITLDEDCLAKIASELALSGSDAAELLGFAKELAEGGPEVLAVCRGTSCSMRGADRLHARLREILGAEEGVAWGREVFCLGHCDLGPSLRIERRVYCADIQKVHRDDRAWREGAARDVPVSQDRT